MKHYCVSFNLVIEKLMIPTALCFRHPYAFYMQFQSRNRETYDSNLGMGSGIGLATGSFQSRNRETYDSNSMFWMCLVVALASFQSRNRETYDSNFLMDGVQSPFTQSFNLVIEKLMIPTFSVQRWCDVHRCFNLVIEKLMIPTKITTYGGDFFISCFNLVIEKLMIPTKGIQLSSPFKA